MIRVAHVIAGLRRGGAETALKRIATRFDRRRFETRVIVMDPADTPLVTDLETAGIPVHRDRVPIPSLFRLKADVIQGWMYYGNLAALTGPPAPVVWNLRCGTEGIGRAAGLAARACGRLAFLASAIVNNSRRSAREHESIAGFAGRPMTIIPNGFDLDEFAPSTDHRGSVRRELGVPSDTILVGLVGRWDPLKDHRTFLRAASKLPAEVHIVMAGDGVSRSNPDLELEIRECGLGGRVHCLSDRSDMARLMASFDLLGSSSIAEGFPNVIGEAMACGVPCAVTDVGDSAWITGGTGIVVPPRDPDALGAAISALVNLSAESRRALGASARERIARLFSLDAVVDQYQDLYSRLAETSQPREALHVRHRRTA